MWRVEKIKTSSPIDNIIIAKYVIYCNSKKNNTYNRGLKAAASIYRPDKDTVSPEQELKLQHGFEQSKIEEYLQKFSISTIEHIGAKEFKERYIHPKDLKMDVVEMERFILAEIK